MSALLRKRASALAKRLVVSVVVDGIWSNGIRDLVVARPDAPFLD